jgi:serine/threonine protein kinase
VTWGPGVRVGRYELLSPIAQGGMAEVWLARQSGPEGFEKVVALKRILESAGGSAESVKMFLDEARIAAQLSHPNIAQIFELAEEGGSYHLAMEYLEGETLSHVLRRARELSQALAPGLAVRIVSDAAGGLGHAHKKRARTGQALQIVHRDVSPQNIMVTYEGVVKVVDFGIARAAGRQARTQLGSVKGKIAYMSPEQARGETVDATCDVFALGVVLFEALTGTRLHEGDDDLRVLQRLGLNEPLPSVRSRRPDVAPELDGLVARAMSVTPGERFPNGIEMQVALEGWLRTAPPPSSSFELRQFVQQLFADRLRARSMTVEGMAARVTDREVPALQVGPIPDSPVRERPTAPESAPQRGTQPTVASRPPKPVMSPAKQAVVARPPEPPRAPVKRPSRGPWIIAAGAAAGLAIGGIWAMRAPPQQPVVIHAPPAPVVKVQPAPAPTPPPAAAEPAPTPAPQPEPAHAPVKPVAKSKGKLRLETDPYTQVFMHGRKLGDTPLIDVELPAGTHQLHLVNADEHIDEHIEVEISSGQVTRKKLKLQ